LASQGAVQALPPLAWSTIHETAATPVESPPPRALPGDQQAAPVLEPPSV
jgi:hypothetical protein